MESPDRGPGDSTTGVEGGGAADTSIGPYRLIRTLGIGGMGEVWLAEQVRPVHRLVALKVIKPGMDSRQVIARFEAERQALALMDAPCIAAVFDGGVTEGGRPYFVMEYVQGEPITTYCDRHRLSVARAAGAVRTGVRWRPARPSERRHPSRSQAVERARHRARRSCRPQDHRLRRRQGHGAASDRAHAVHRAGRR